MLDRAEAGLELVREAASQAGLALSEDLAVVIDVGADKLFDQVHNKVCAYRWCRAEVAMYSRAL